MDGTEEWVVEGTMSYLVTLIAWAAEFRWMDTWVSEGYPTGWKTEWYSSKLGGWFTSPVEVWCSSMYILTTKWNMCIAQLIGTVRDVQKHIFPSALW